MPIVMVVRLEGQLPQAPCRRRYTTGPSISTNSTLPPSDMRYGRICSPHDGRFVDESAQICQCIHLL